MLDPRHCEDTLFLVFESDFRFYERDDLPPEKWLPLAVARRQEQSMREHVALDESEEEDEASMEVDAVGEAARAPLTWANEPGRFRGAQQGTRPGAKKYDVQDELVDLVQMCNVAARKDAGDLVWLGWNAADPGKKPPRKTAPKYGAQLLAYTPNGARECLRAMQTARPQHYDCWLLYENLNKPTTVLGQAKTCYVIPPVGGYAAHESQNYRGGGGQTRPSSWQADWCQEGTRPHGPKQLRRWLAHFTPKGPPVWITELQLPPFGTELHWATLAPPAHWHDPDPTWQRLLLDRRWVSQTGLWIGPARGQTKGKALKGKSGSLSPRAKGKRSGKGQAKGKQVPLEWKRLVEEPDGFNVDQNGMVSPITRLAEQLVTSAFDEDEWTETSDRKKRARAFRVSQYKHRFFVEDPSEVQLVRSDCCRTMLR